MDLNGNLILAVDFDGTLSLGATWPEIGQPNNELFEYLHYQQLVLGSRIILNTCRQGEPLLKAVEFCMEQGLIFDAVNENLPELIEAYGSDTRKISADYYIDDKSLYPVPGLKYNENI